MMSPPLSKPSTRSVTKPPKVRTSRKLKDDKPAQAAVSISAPVGQAAPTLASAIINNHAEDWPRLFSLLEGALEKIDYNTRSLVSLKEALCEKDIELQENVSRLNQLCREKDCNIAKLESDMDSLKSKISVDEVKNDYITDLEQKVKKLENMAHLQDKCDKLQDELTDCKLTMYAMEKDFGRKYADEFMESIKPPPTYEAASVMPSVPIAHPSTDEHVLPSVPIIHPSTDEQILPSVPIVHPSTEEHVISFSKTDSFTQPLCQDITKHDVPDDKSIHDSDYTFLATPSIIFDDLPPELEKYVNPPKKNEINNSEDDFHLLSQKFEMKNPDSHCNDPWTTVLKRKPKVYTNSNIRPFIKQDQVELSTIKPYDPIDERQKSQRKKDGVFLSRLDPKETEASVATYINSKYNCNMNVRKLTTKYPGYASFHLTGKDEDVARLLKAKWPGNALVKPFFVNSMNRTEVVNLINLDVSTPQLINTQ